MKAHVISLMVFLFLTNNSVASESARMESYEGINTRTAKDGAVSSWQDSISYFFFYKEDGACNEDFLIAKNLDGVVAIYEKMAPAYHPTNGTYFKVTAYYQDTVIRLIGNMIFYGPPCQWHTIDFNGIGTSGGLHYLGAFGFIRDGKSPRFFRRRILTDKNYAVQFDEVSDQTLVESRYMTHDDAKQLIGPAYRKHFGP